MARGMVAAAQYEVITDSAGNRWVLENRMAQVLAGVWSARRSITKPEALTEPQIDGLRRHSGARG